MDCISYSLVLRSRVSLGFNLRTTVFGCGAYVDNVELAFQTDMCTLILDESSQAKAMLSESVNGLAGMGAGMKVEIGDVLLTVDGKSVCDEPFAVIVARIRTGRRALKKRNVQIVPSSTELRLQFARYVHLGPCSPNISAVASLPSLSLYDVTMDPRRLPWYLDYVFTHFSGHDQGYTDDYEIAKALLWVEVCQLLHDYQGYLRCLCSGTDSDADASSSPDYIPVSSVSSAAFDKTSEMFVHRALVVMKKVFSPNSISNTSTGSPFNRSTCTPNATSACLNGLPMPNIIDSQSQHMHSLSLSSAPASQSRRTGSCHDSEYTRNRGRNRSGSVSTFSLFHLLPLELQQQIMDQVMISTVKRASRTINVQEAVTPSAAAGDVNLSTSSLVDQELHAARNEEDSGDSNRVFSFLHASCASEVACFTEPQYDLLTSLQEWLHEELDVRSFHAFKFSTSSLSADIDVSKDKPGFSDGWRRMEAHMSRGHNTGAGAGVVTGAAGRKSSILSVMPSYYSNLTLCDLLNDASGYIPDSESSFSTGLMRKADENWNSCTYAISTGSGLLFSYFYLFAMNSFRGDDVWMLYGVICLKWIWIWRRHYRDRNQKKSSTTEDLLSISRSVQNLLAVVQVASQWSNFSLAFVKPLQEELAHLCISLKNERLSTTSPRGTGSDNGFAMNSVVSGIGHVLLRVQCALVEVLEQRCQVTAAFLASNVFADMLRTLEMSSQPWVLQFKPDSGAKLLQQVSLATNKWKLRQQQERFALLGELDARPTLSLTGTLGLVTDACCLPRSRSQSISSVTTASSSSSVAWSDEDLHRRSVPAKETETIALVPQVQSKLSSFNDGTSKLARAGDYVLADTVALHRGTLSEKLTSDDRHANAGALSHDTSVIVWAVLYDVVQSVTAVSGNRGKEFRVRYIIPIPLEDKAGGESADCQCADADEYADAEASTHNYQSSDTHRACVLNSVLLEHLLRSFYRDYDHSVLAEGFETLLGRELPTTGSDENDAVMLASVHTELTISPSTLKAQVGSQAQSRSNLWANADFCPYVYNPDPDTNPDIDTAIAGIGTKEGIVDGLNLTTVDEFKPYNVSILGCVQQWVVGVELQQWLCDPDRSIGPEMTSVHIHDVPQVPVTNAQTTDDCTVLREEDLSPASIDIAVDVDINVDVPVVAAVSVATAVGNDDEVVQSDSVLDCERRSDPVSAVFTVEKEEDPPSAATSHVCEHVVESDCSVSHENALESPQQPSLVSRLQLPTKPPINSAIPKLAFELRTLVNDSSCNTSSKSLSHSTLADIDITSSVDAISCNVRKICKKPSLKKRFSKMLRRGLSWSLLSFSSKNTLVNANATPASSDDGTDYYYRFGRNDEAMANTLDQKMTVTDIDHECDVEKGIESRLGTIEETKPATETETPSPLDKSMGDVSTLINCNIDIESVPVTPVPLRVNLPAHSSEKEGNTCTMHRDQENACCDCNQKEDLDLVSPLTTNPADNPSPWDNVIPHNSSVCIAATVTESVVASTSDGTDENSFDDDGDVGTGIDFTAVQTPLPSPTVAPAVSQISLGSQLRGLFKTQELVTGSIDANVCVEANVGSVSNFCRGGGERLETVVGSGIGLYSTTRGSSSTASMSSINFRTVLQQFQSALCDNDASDCVTCPGDEHHHNRLTTVFKLLHPQVDMQDQGQVAQILSSMLHPLLTNGHFVSAPIEKPPPATMAETDTMVEIGAVLAVISVQHLTFLFLAFLLEQKVIILSSKMSAILALCEWLKGCIRPLSYCPTYAPTVCNHASLQMIQCPTPFCLGWYVHAPSGDCGAAAAAVRESIQTSFTLNTFDRINDNSSSNSTADDVLLLDLDNDQCTVPVCMTGFLTSVAAPLVRNVRRVLFSSYYTADNLPSPPHCYSDKMQIDQVSLIYHQFVAELLTGAEACTVAKVMTNETRSDTGMAAAYTGEVVSLFDENLFQSIKNVRSTATVLSTHMSIYTESTYARVDASSTDPNGGSADSEFISMFCRTQALSEYVSAFADSNRKY